MKKKNESLFLDETIRMKLSLSKLDSNTGKAGLEDMWTLLGVLEHWV